MVHADMAALAKAMGTTVGAMRACAAAPASPPAALAASPRAAMDDGDALVEAPPAEEWGAYVSGGAVTEAAEEAAPAAGEAACVKRVEALEARMQQLGTA